MSTPAVRQLKAVTGARITWAVDAGMSSLLEGHPDVDELLLFPRDPFGNSSVSPVARRLTALVSELRKTTFDLAIDLQGRGRSYLLLLLSRARKKIGRGMFPFIEHQLPHRRRTVRHAVEACLEPLDVLGLARPSAPKLNLYSSEADHRKVAGLIGSGNSGLYTLLPAASWDSKLWPEACWATLADWLTDRGKIIALAGCTREAALAQRIASKVRRPERLRLFFGALSLRELKPLFELSEAVVGCDTGPLHIAAATRAPLLALYGPTDPRRTGPWPPGRGHILRPAGCDTCLLPRCRRRCLQALGPEEVIDKLSFANLDPV
ncbi:MAG: glycosyltransferase family 9 protein [Acidobacteria bacterium]|nr:glycosyltransferase family 9 protein [Acidobacteriota bacterium]